MNIYIARHGETIWNKSRLLQGSRDIELCDDGRAIAYERAKQIADVDFDIVYSSPLKRAYETACILRGDRDIPIIKDDRLREVNFGINEGKCSLELKKDKNSPIYKFFEDPGNYQHRKVESRYMMCAREPKSLWKKLLSHRKIS